MQHGHQRHSCKSRVLQVKPAFFPHLPGIVKLTDLCLAVMHALMMCLLTLAHLICLLSDPERAQAIEAAIELGLARVEAGAQGEHKIQRGYLPSYTYSSHYVRDERVSDAIGDFLLRENMQMQYRLHALTQQVSPFKPFQAAAS